MVLPMTQIAIEQVCQTPVALRHTEHAECKGIGHPDTICDCVMEAVSVALCRVYFEDCGQILHHNIDQGLLVAGQSKPRLGGGEILRPLRLVFGGRATYEAKNGHRFPVGDLAQEAAQS